MTKRLFDIFFGVLTLIFFGGILLICILIASADTKSFGLFVQNRIGQNGIIFKIYKIKTFSDYTKEVTQIGAFFRRSKLDELPQLVNILLGQMSFVGPRPDISGYADFLQGTDRIILTVKPGITGLASLKYRNEEALLHQQKNPILYNDTVIWPDKVRINKWYVENRTLWMDVVILFCTIAPSEFEVEEFMKSKWNYNLFL